MSNGIKRKRTVGIAAESAYANASATGSSTFVLPIVDYNVEDVTTIIENEAAVGSSYGVNDTMVATEMSNVSMTLKVDEDQLPLFFKQCFDINSSAASGETVVYQHVLSYNSSNTGTSYVLRIDDPDRDNLYVPGVKWESMNFVAEPGGFFTVELSGRGRHSETWTGSNTVTEFKEFAGRNATYQLVDQGTSYANYSALMANFNFTFGLSDDGDNFTLGSRLMQNLFTTVSRFEAEITALLSDYTLRDKYRNNTTQKSKVIVTDTARFVTGSVANTSPSITFEYPAQKIIAWAEDGDLNAVLKQKFTLLATDQVGTADTPVKITVVNAIASY